MSCITISVKKSSRVGVDVELKKKLSVSAIKKNPTLTLLCAHVCPFDGDMWFVLGTHKLGSEKLIK